MKKIILTALLLSAAVLIFGQTGDRSDNAGPAKNVQSGGKSGTKLSELPPQKTDIDLTRLNYNMATALIYQILSDESGKYLGKTIRIKGVYSYDDTVYGIFHYVLLFDATACCQTGFIFEDKRRRYPQDYPEAFDDIEIIGTLCERTIDGMDMIYIECWN